MVQWAGAHHRAKFCKNWSIRWKGIEVFDFFNMVAVHHLGYVWGIFGPPTETTTFNQEISKGIENT